MADLGCQTRWEIRSYDWGMKAQWLAQWALQADLPIADVIELFRFWVK